MMRTYQIAEVVDDNWEWQEKFIKVEFPEALNRDNTEIKRRFHECLIYEGIISPSETIIELDPVPTGEYTESFGVYNKDYHQTIIRLMDVTDDFTEENQRRKKQAVKKRTGRRGTTELLEVEETENPAAYYRLRTDALITPMNVTVQYRAVDNEVVDTERTQAGTPIRWEPVQAAVDPEVFPTRPDDEVEDDWLEDDEDEEAP